MLARSTCSVVFTVSVPDGFAYSTCAVITGMCGDRLRRRRDDCRPGRAFTLRRSRAARETRQRRFGAGGRPRLGWSEPLTGRPSACSPGRRGRFGAHADTVVTPTGAGLTFRFSSGHDAPLRTLDEAAFFTRVLSDAEVAALGPAIPRRRLRATASGSSSTRVDSSSRTAARRGHAGRIIHGAAHRRAHRPCSDPRRREAVVTPELAWALRALAVACLIDLTVLVLAVVIVRRRRRGGPCDRDCGPAGTRSRSESTRDPRAHHARPVRARSATIGRAVTFADDQIVYRDLAGAWGSFRLVIGGQDVTRFRDVPAQIGGYQLQEPYGYGPADFSFPQITSLEVDAWGTGDLSWFDIGKPVQLVQVDEDGRAGPYRVARLRVAAVRVRRRDRCSLRRRGVRAAVDARQASRAVHLGQGRRAPAR